VRLADVVLGTALMVVLGWPLAATVREAWRGSEAATGGGLISPFPAQDGGAGGVARPLGLAEQTARLVLITEALALPAGVALGLLLFRTDLWGRRGLIGLLALAAFVPMPLHAIAWIGGFGNLGRSQVLGARPWLVGLTGAAVVHAMASLPWVVLLAGVGLRTVEPELEEAALLDLPAWRVLARVTLRRGVGAIAGAALAVAVLTAGDMTVTDLLVVRTYAEEAYVQYQLGHGPDAAAAVALPPLVVLGGLVFLASWGLLRADPARVPSADTRVRLWTLGRWRVPLGLLAWATVGNVVALPLYALVWRAGRVGGSAALGRAPRWSLHGLVQTLGRAGSEVAGPLLETMLWAALGASAAVALAWPLAWAARRPGPWRWVVAASVALTLAVPGPVAGMALILAYNAAPPALDAPLVPWLIFLARTFVYDTPLRLLLAYVLRTLPYAVLVLWPALRSIPEVLLDAAALDGHGPWGQVRRVVLPLSRGALLAAWGVAFVLALGELPATNLVAPPGMDILSVLVWGLLHTGVESHLAGVGLVMLAAFAAAGLLAVAALGWVYGPR
jgi:iron(III) transport system permease protein